MRKKAGDNPLERIAAVESGPIHVPRRLNTDRLRQRQQEREQAMPDLIKSEIETRRKKWEAGAQERWDNYIPRRWKKARLSNFDGEAYRLGQRVINGIIEDNPLSSFMVWSPITGNGKTFFVFAVLNELRARGIADMSNTGFYTEMDIADAAIAGFERDDKLTEITRGRRFLFVDDLSDRAQYGWGKNNAVNRENIWFEILNWAYSNGIQVFLTSNRSPQAIHGLIGDVAYERLHHLTGNGDNILELTRESVRSDLAEDVKRFYGSKRP